MWILNLIFRFLGWISTFFWSIGFYFQIYSLVKHKTGDGISYDFIIMNIQGFAFLNIVYFYNYFAKFSDVFLSDLAFSVHSLIMSLWILIVTLYYPKKRNKLSFTGYCSSILIIIFTILYYYFNKIFKNQVNVLEFIGMNKIVLTIYKYLFQVIFHIKKKNTIGWSASNTYFDMLGSSFVILQNISDIYFKVSNIIDILNGTKFLLGLVSITFDLILLIQIYIIYPKKKNYQTVNTQVK